MGEPSRNKALSGTGLGLPIVKKIAGQFGYTVHCIQKNHTITFEVNFSAETFGNLLSLTILSHECNNQALYFPLQEEINT